MGRNRKQKKKEAQEIPHWGTRTDMVIKTDLSVEIDDEVFDVMAKDKDGFYYTKSHLVGTGLFDSNRHPSYNRSLSVVPSNVIEALEQEALTPSS